MPISKNKHPNLEYNNTCKRARITIFKSELDKCMTNQPFEINYQLPKKPKPPIIVDPDPRPPKPSKIDLLIERFDEFSENVITRLSKVETTLSSIIELNNLKTK